MQPAPDMNTAQRGFTLIEVLVAVVVLGLGLTGIAGLQIVSVRSTQQAAQRTLATHMAYDIVDRMRANADAARNGDYDTAFADDVSALDLCFGTAADCSPVQLAGHDRRMWRQGLAGLLPDGAGSVATALVGTQTQATVRVRWIEATAVLDGNGDPVPQSLQLVISL